MKKTYYTFEKLSALIRLMSSNYNLSWQQMLHLLIIKDNYFNDFKGGIIFNDLLNNRNLWESVAHLPYVSLYQGNLTEDAIKKKVITTYADEFTRPLLCICLLMIILLTTICI